MRILTILAAGCAAILPATAPFAADMYQVPVGATMTIDEHGTCKKVTNNGSNPIMVPTHAAKEWAVGANAFLNNITAMNQVSVSECGFSYEISSEYNFFCGVEMPGPGSLPACAGKFGKWVNDLRADGITPRGITPEQIDEKIPEYGGVADREVVLNVICKNPDLVPSPGVYMTLKWSGGETEEGPIIPGFGVMFGVVYECE